MNSETQIQLDAFIGELMTRMGEIGCPVPKTFDASDLYAKYPKVKVGIRRALIYADSLCRALKRRKIEIPSDGATSTG